MYLWSASNQLGSSASRSFWILGQWKQLYHVSLIQQTSLCFLTCGSGFEDSGGENPASKYFLSLCSAFLQLFPWPEQALCLLSVSSWERISKGLNTGRLQQIGVITASHHYKLNTENGTHFIISSIIVDIAF